jgi:hypothetical protein
MVTLPQVGRGRWGGGFSAPSWGLGDDVRPITSAIGSGLLSAGGVIAAIPGGQLPGAIVAAVGALTGLIGGLFAPDLTKVEATHIVDAIQVQLEGLLHSWYALPAEQKTRQNQAAFLELIDAALNKVRQGCSNPALQEAGQRCISERLIQGGTAPWCPTGTGCDWITTYRDPIANDPAVVQNATQAAPSGGSTSQTPAGGTQTIGGFTFPAFDMQTMYLVGGIALLVFGVLALASGGDD